MFTLKSKSICSLRSGSLEAESNMGIPVLSGETSEEWGKSDAEGEEAEQESDFSEV